MPLQYLIRCESLATRQLKRAVLTGFAMIVFTMTQTAGAQELNPTPAWQSIEKYFSPPPEFVGKKAKDLRSPLLFENGEQVQKSEDWPKRRQEILSKWHNLMGAWPKVLEDQQMEVLQQEAQPGYSRLKVRLQFSPLHKTEGYLLIPEGEGERPAVVVVYYEPETAIGEGGADRDFALQLTKRGFVTLSVGLAEAAKEETYALYYPNREKATIQPLSAMAYAAANSYHALANRPEVDPKRVGIVGHSFGGKWAMFASCLYDKWACAAWSDGGIILQDDRGSINYWEPWYLGYEIGKWRKRGMPTADNPVHGLYPKLRRDCINLHELHALMAPRPFLVSGGSEDPVSRWQVLNHTLEVNRLLGFENRIAMTNRPDHSPNPQSNEVLYQFFEHFLLQHPELLAK